MNDMIWHEWHDLTWMTWFGRPHSRELAMKAEGTVGAPTCCTSCNLWNAMSLQIINVLRYLHLALQMLSRHNKEKSSLPLPSATSITFHLRPKQTETHSRESEMLKKKDDRWDDRFSFTSDSQTLTATKRGSTPSIKWRLTGRVFSIRNKQYFIIQWFTKRSLASVASQCLNGQGAFYEADFFLSDLGLRRKTILRKLAFPISPYLMFWLSTSSSKRWLGSTAFYYLNRSLHNFAFTNLSLDRS
jgi:hypothetical protein